MVSVDTLEDNTKFAQTHEADYPIMSDVTKAVAKAYGVLGPGDLARRWTFYIGPTARSSTSIEPSRPRLRARTW